jgi:methylglyoxal synthase
LDYRLRLALIAHDQKKDDMVAFALMNRILLQPHDFVATGTTGGLIKNACSELNIKRLNSGPLGGDLQIGALIAEGKVDGLIFFVDPLTPMPHDVDVKALMRVALVYDIPMALNKATAELLLDTLLKSPLKTKAVKGRGKQND